MAISQMFQKPIVRNTAIGLGIAILVPIAVKLLAPLVRPLGRSTVKVGVVAVEKGRETAAELREIFEDMVAEVREEMRAEDSDIDADDMSIEDQSAEAPAPEIQPQTESV